MPGKYQFIIGLLIMKQLILGFLRSRSLNKSSLRQDKKKNWKAKLYAMLMVNWHLGITSFGGPATHFQIVKPVICQSGRVCFDFC